MEEGDCWGQVYQFEKAVMQVGLDVSEVRLLRKVIPCSVQIILAGKLIMGEKVMNGGQIKLSYVYYKDMVTWLHNQI